MQKLRRFWVILLLFAPSILHQRALAQPNSFSPVEMALIGDYATAENCTHPTVCNWLAGTLPGTVILGVDPASPNPQDWDGAQAMLAISLPLVYTPTTTMLLSISTPNLPQKGLHSPQWGNTARIFWDSVEVWSKKTLQRSANGDFYALSRQTMLTTLVLRAPGSHNLRIVVPPQTAWDIDAVSFQAFSPLESVRGVGYAPYRDCQMPGGSDAPSIAQITEDMQRLSHIANAVRTYSATGIDAQVPAIAHQAGLAVYAGAWLDEVSGDTAEINGIIEIAWDTPVSTVIVGNEVYLRHRNTETLQHLREAIQDVRLAIPPNVPVTTAELDNLVFVWDSVNDPHPEINPLYAPIIEEVDFLTIHIYPFWNKQSPRAAAAQTIARFLAMQQTLNEVYPGKRLIIGEAGWPSAGQLQAAAITGVAIQRAYLLELLPLIESNAIDLLYFDAFDEFWKVSEPGRVGQHWGFSYADRSAKHNFYGVLFPAATLPPHSGLQTVFLPLLQNGTGGSPQQVHAIYTEWPPARQTFVPSGFMGDVDWVGINECSRAVQPHTGELSISVTYNPQGVLGWSGVYWQYPANNWGDLPEGMDLSGYTALTFWARGAQGNEQVEFFIGGVGPTSTYPDSIQPKISLGWVTLTTEWQFYRIPLTNANLTHVVGGFGWASNRDHSPENITFYLDDILFVRAR